MPGPAAPGGGLAQAPGEAQGGLSWAPDFRVSRAGEFVFWTRLGVGFLSPPARCQLLPFLFLVGRVQPY